MNNSGVNQTVFNELERARSADLNQMQAMAAHHTQTIFRNLIGQRSPDVLNNEPIRGIELSGSDNAAPMASEVYGGLRVRPLVTDLLITGGCLCGFENDAARGPYDSQYTFLQDPGIATVGVLTFVANAGPGRRIDVVECAVVQQEVVNEMVDIFDVPTQTFVPAAMTKVTGQRLTYRIRQGTQGAGYPGHVSGWLPLAIASHASSSTSFNDVHFWDVRPLVADRNRGMLARSTAENGVRIHKRYHGVTTSGAEDRLAGFYDMEGEGVDGNDCGIYQVQGAIKDSLPGSSANQYLLLRDSKILSPGTTFAGQNKWMYVYALFPLGLPRWVPYQTVPGSGGERRPENVMGIMALSSVEPGFFGGTGITPIAIPTASGLTGTAPGRCVATVFRCDNISTDFLNGAMNVRGALVWQENTSITTMQITGAVISSTSTTELIDFEFSTTASIIPPAGVERIRARFVFVANVATAAMWSITNINFKANAISISKPSDVRWSNSVPSASYTYTVDFDLELPPAMVGRDRAPLVLTFNLNFPSGTSISSRVLHILGYTLANQ